MRKRLTWLLVTIGVAALVRRLRRRHAEPAPAEPVPPAGDPAEELRRKLDESRAESSPAEPTPGASVPDRRAEVHDEGRAALDEMRARDEEG